MYIGKSEKEVVFHSEGEQVFGTLALPDKNNEGEKLPAIVLAHGYGSFRDELTGFIDIADKLKNKGIISLRIDLRGCGKSGKPGRIHPFSEWITDVMSAISYLQSLSKVNPKRIGLIGMSVGGGVVCWAGAIDQRVKCIVALASVADGEWWLEHLWINKGGQSTWKEFLEKLQEDMVHQAVEGETQLVNISDVLAYGLEDVNMMEEMFRNYPEFTRKLYLSSPISLLHFKPVNMVNRIQAIPIRLIHSKDDTSVPVKHSEALYKNINGEKDLQIISDSPHCFWLGSRSKQVQELTIEWIERYL